MIVGEVLQKSFVCNNCQKTRITIQMLQGRTVPVTCRVCDQDFEVFERNGKIQVSELTWRRRKNLIAMH